MRVLSLILIFPLIISCGGKLASPISEEAAPAHIPNGLEFDREISGPVLAYPVKRPSGVAISSTGDLFFSDTGNHRLVKLDRNLKAVEDYGGYGAAIGKFQNPEDLYVDRGLNLYVVDVGNRRIVQLDANLNYTDDFRVEDDPEEIISNPGKLSGIEISSIGEIIVSDYDNSRLIRMDNFKRFSRYIGDFGYGEGALLSPLGLARDRKDRIFVADAGNGRVAIFDDYGNYMRQLGQGILKRPSAVAVDDYGVVWVGDQELDIIYAFSLDGSLLFQEGSSGRAEMQFDAIAGLAISPEGRLVVADAGNDRLMIYNVSYEGN